MATQPASSIREKIRFAPNQPIELTLESPGVEQAGTYGVEWRYFCEGHKIMWVPTIAHQQIDRIHQEGTSYPFSIEISQRKNGRAAATWEVVHLEDEPPTAAVGRRGPQPEPASPPAAKPSQQPAAAMPAGSRALALDPPTEVGSDSLYTCMCAAIRVAAAAEKFASQIGRPLAFETSDIRAMAASLYIEGRGGRGR